MDEKPSKVSIKNKFSLGYTKRPEKVFLSNNYSIYDDLIVKSTIQINYFLK